ncbi:hypothetical protein [Leucobacter sp. 1207-22]|uniref:hypothetical protein n=1 Tax=Leucobacter sp. 1207-22 TaxID=2604456 RepID=UPI004064170F
MKLKQYRGISIFSILALLLTGCTYSEDISIWRSGATTVESRRWIGAQLDAVINASGTSASWKNYEGSSVMEWSDEREARARLLNGLGVGYCRNETPDDIDGNQSRVVLKNSDSGNGAPVVALRVAALLSSDGWDVHLSPETEADDWSVRASRTDRARVILSAFPYGLSLIIDAPCSSRPVHYGGIDRDTVPSVLEPVLEEFRRLPATKEERAVWSPMQRDPAEPQEELDLDEETKR